MVQLVMDPESKCYKVILVGPREGRGGGEPASIYGSVTGEWTNTEAFTDLIFGYCYRWIDDDGYLNSGCNIPEGQGPCVYDGASGNLIELNDECSPWFDDEVLRPGKTSYVLVKDRLFVLHEETYRYEHAGVVEDRQRYCISEYQAQAQRLRWHWVKVRVHMCSKLEDSTSVVYRYVHLYGCNGILLVTAVTADRSDLAWLYSLSTGKWQAISAVPKEGWADDGTMFELQWDAVP